MLEICLLDDDKTALFIARSAIEGYFSSKGVPFHLNAYTKGNELLQECKGKRIDLAILDIEMPEIDGIEVAKELARRDFTTTVIFLSQREDLVFESLSVHPFAFIRKNKMMEDFQKSMDFYMDSVYEKQARNDTICIKDGKTMLNLKIGDIMYIEGNRNYQKFHLRDGQTPEARLVLNDLEEQLVPFGFIRIHKGFLVNVQYIRRIEQKHVQMTNEARLPLSDRAKEDVMKRFLELTRKDSVFLD